MSRCSKVKDVGEQALELFGTSQSLSCTIIPTILITDLSRRAPPIVLAQDDYQPNLLDTLQ